MSEERVEYRVEGMEPEAVVRARRVYEALDGLRERVLGLLEWWERNNRRDWMESGYKEKRMAELKREVEALTWAAEAAHGALVEAKGGVWE